MLPVCVFGIRSTPTLILKAVPASIRSLNRMQQLIIALKIALRETENLFILMNHHLLTFYQLFLKLGKTHNDRRTCS